MMLLLIYLFFITIVVIIETTKAPITRDSERGACVVAVLAVVTGPLTSGVVAGTIVEAPAEGIVPSPVVPVLKLVSEPYWLETVRRTS
jgi:hypothetical protein